MLPMNLPHDQSKGIRHDLLDLSILGTSKHVFEKSVIDHYEARTGDEQIQSMMLLPDFVKFYYPCSTDREKQHYLKFANENQAEYQAEYDATLPSAIISGKMIFRLRKTKCGFGGLTYMPAYGRTFTDFKTEAARAKVLASPMEVQGVQLVFTDKFAAIRRQGTRYSLLHCPSGLQLATIQQHLQAYGTVFKATPATMHGFVLADRWEITIQLLDSKPLPPKVPFGAYQVSCLPCSVCRRCNNCSGYRPADPVTGKRTRSESAMATSSSLSPTDDKKKQKNFRHREARRAQKKARQDAMEVDAEAEKLLATPILSKEDAVVAAADVTMTSAPVNTAPPVVVLVAPTGTAPISLAYAPLVDNHVQSTSVDMLDVSLSESEGSDSDAATPTRKSLRGRVVSRQNTPEPDLGVKSKGKGKLPGKAAKTKDLQARLKKQKNVGDALA
ncbi:hypothetical protein PS15p_211445 [Mucor circinelloides]